MNVLVIDRSVPIDLLQGNALIGYHLFSRLRRHRLTLICPAPAREIARYQSALAKLFDVVHLVPRERPVHALQGLAEPSLARRGIALGGRVDVAAVRAFEERVARVLAADTIDVIHTRQLPMAATSARIAHPAKLLELIDSEALQATRRMDPAAPRTIARYLAARLLEQRTVRHFDVCTTVAEADARVIRQLAPGLSVRVVPNGVDAAYFTPLDLPEDPETLIFAGAMSFPPNVSAVLHFYRSILPLIRRTNPAVRLVVAGRDPAPAIVALDADPLVTVTGFVEDLRPWLSRASIVICPMTSGSGIKNKVLEALAMARPVVSSTLGIEALEVRDGREVLVGDSPEDFAAAVVALLPDPAARRRLGQAGRALVERRYTWDACAASYEALYLQLRERAAARGHADLRMGATT